MQSVFGWLRDPVDEEERGSAAHSSVRRRRGGVGVRDRAQARGAQGFELLASALAQTHSVAIVWIPVALGALGVSWK
jgi:hypothetical protein